MSGPSEADWGIAERRTREATAHRAVLAADELAASIRAMQSAGLTRREIRDTIGVNRFILNALLTQWGLDR